MKKMKIKQLIFCLSLLFLYVQVSAQDSLKIYLQKGGKGLLDKDFEKAENNFLSALRFSPASFVALKNLGVVYSATGDQKKAKEYFENANKVNSMDAELNNNLGVIYSNENNILKAIAHFEKAVGYDSTKALYFTSLAQEYSKVSQIGLAIPLLYKARKLDAVNPLISYILGNCFAESNSYDSAKYYYLDSKSKGGNSWELNYFLGRVRVKLGESELAIKNYEEALELNKNCTNCRQSYGLALFYHRDYKQAVKQLKKVVKAEPNNYGAWLALGASFSLNDQTKEANKILDKLFKVDSAIGFQLLDLISTEYIKYKDK